MKSLNKSLLKSILSFIVFCFLESAIYATKIDISNEWLTQANGSEQTERGRKNILFDAGIRMQENDTDKETFRLVICPNGEVYISSETGESWRSWGSGFFTKDSANQHNIGTHKILLDLVYNETQSVAREHLLRVLHQDWKSTVSQLMQKDIKLKILEMFLREWRK